MKQSVKKFFKYLKWCRQGGYTHFNAYQINYPSILEGQKVLITGGSDGIGLAIARKFLAAGASIVITGRNAGKLEKAVEELHSDKLFPLQWDIKDINLIEPNLARVNELLDGLTILVNNAAYVSWNMMDPKSYDVTMDTNTRSVYFMCMHCAEFMKRNNGSSGGKIINISSINAYEHNASPYFISKRAVNAITEGFAAKYAPYNIFVNGIAPGFCNSSINKLQSDNAFFERGTNNCIVDPSQIAEVAAFLASGASNGIIGQTIVCDNGALL